MTRKAEKRPIAEERPTSQDHPIRLAVIGVGHLGSLHVQKLCGMADVHVVGVVDPDAAQRQRILTAHGVPGFGTLTELLQAMRHDPRVDQLKHTHLGARDQAEPQTPLHGVIIAAPTVHHAALITQALQHDLHVLVEKPIATHTQQAQQVCELACARGKWLQVGHTERFNPAIRAALGLLADDERVLYIVAERLGPFPGGRGTDVDVVLDRMIHDLDIVAALVPAALAEVRALGVPIISHEADMASARLQFANGTVAQLSAGRASLEHTRKLRLFTTQRYISIDCMARTVHAVRRLPARDGSDWPQIIGEAVDVPERDALADQDAHFVACIRHRSTPMVDGKAGMRALGLAEAVLDAMRDHLGIIDA